jgi:hypothetical protein
LLCRDVSWFVVSFLRPGVPFPPIPFIPSLLLRLLRFLAPSGPLSRRVSPLCSIASGERCESVAEKRSKQRTTAAYTRLLAHDKDAQPLVTLINIE